MTISETATFPKVRNKWLIPFADGRLVLIMLLIGHLCCALLTWFDHGPGLQSWAALPLLYNRVKPYPWYGFRIPKTLSDERIWYPANSYAAKGMILTGIITIVVAGVLRLTIRLQAGLGSRFCFQSNTIGPACLSRDVRRFRMLSPQRKSN